MAVMATRVFVVVVVVVVESGTLEQNMERGGGGEEGEALLVVGCWLCWLLGAEAEETERDKDAGTHVPTWYLPT